MSDTEITTDKNVFSMLLTNDQLLLKFTMLSVYI